MFLVYIKSFSVLGPGPGPGHYMILVFVPVKAFWGLYINDSGVLLKNKIKKCISLLIFEAPLANLHEYSSGIFEAIAGSLITGHSK